MKAFLAMHITPVMSTFSHLNLYTGLWRTVQSRPYRHPRHNRHINGFIQHNVRYSLCYWIAELNPAVDPQERSPAARPARCWQPAEICLRMPSYVRLSPQLPFAVHQNMERDGVRCDHACTGHQSGLQTPYTAVPSVSACRASMLRAPSYKTMVNTKKAFYSLASHYLNQLVCHRSTRKPSLR